MSSFLDTEGLPRDLKGRTVRGGITTAATQATLFLFKCASVPVLARLLTPADFGLVAMVTVITGFITIFEDAGLSMATVQRARITHEQISTLFWINVAIGMALMLVTAGLAPGIAWLYQEPRLVGITLVLASIMLFGSLNVQHIALLQRQMRFGTLGGIQITSRVAGFVTGVTAALLGAGYWALVYMTVAGVLTTLILIWACSGWRPGRPLRGSGVRPMLAFGGSVTGSKLLQYARRNVDNMLIGAVWGAVPLGIYSKAYSLLMLPIQLVHGPISAVAVPALSRLQDDPERFRRFFRKGTELIATFAAPVSVYAFVGADELVIVVLGEQWISCVPIFSVLAPAAFFSSVTSGGTWLFFSLGRTRELLRVSIVQTVLIVAGILIGLPWGPLGVAVGYTLAAIPSAMILLLWAFRSAPVDLSDTLTATWRPALSALIAGVTVMVLRFSGGDSFRPELRLCLLTGVFAVVWLVAKTTLSGGQSPIAEFKSLAMAARNTKAE